MQSWGLMRAQIEASSRFVNANWLLFLNLPIWNQHGAQYGFELACADYFWSFVSPEGNHKPSKAFSSMQVCSKIHVQYWKSHVWMTFGHLNRVQTPKRHSKLSDTPSGIPNGLETRFSMVHVDFCASTLVTIDIRVSASQHFAPRNGTKMLGKTSAHEARV